MLPLCEAAAFDGDVLNDTLLLFRLELKNIGETGEVESALLMSRGSNESAVEMVPRAGGRIIIRGTKKLKFERWKLSLVEKLMLHLSGKYDNTRQ